MKYELAKTFTNVNDKVYKVSDKEDAEDATFATIATQCLLGDTNGMGQPISGQEKLKRFEVYMKIREAKDGFVQLKTEEIQILATSAEILNVLLYGKFKYFLDGVAA